jgi:hypothetical protein
MTRDNRTNSKSHIPKGSFLFEKIVPVSLVVMGIVMLGLIVFAAGVLLGLVKF